MTASVHPARRNPAKTLGLVLFLGLTALGLVCWLAPLSALALWALLLVNLWEFFLPSHYEFGESALLLRRGPFQHSYPWTRYASYTLDRNGILLSPFKVHHPLENFRGTFLALGRDHQEEVATWLSRKLTRLP